MCVTCGCGNNPELKVTNQQHHEHGHNHGNHHHHHHHHHHENDHHHEHHHEEKNKVNLEREILHENNLLAERNRGYFDAKNILCLNLVSSPGSGKTTLLERTLLDLKHIIKFSVIEGDQQTSRDADRINATGTNVQQINTGKGCHLDAHMVLHALQKLKPENDSVLFVENVGNLVCPAMFDLGEKYRIVIMSTTEGDDKPLKYPDMFHSADICIINKTDLLPYVNFSVEKARENALRVNHHLKFFELSCTTGAGMDEWYSWLKSEAASMKTTV
ncbi:MAG: hydrogenase nickel incorporation protein HypB [Saprospiraceae bacterium]|nr:hydrogenase nickel incorporation protein HypB [Saprospiraceae bacterium]